MARDKANAAFLFCLDWHSALPASVAFGQSSAAGSPQMRDWTIGRNDALTHLLPRFQFWCFAVLPLQHPGRRRAVDVPASVESVVEGAFEDCTELESVSFGDGSQLRRIGYGAFSLCDKLAMIGVPASVEYIEFKAFKYCSSLESVLFGKGSRLRAIGDSAFEDCGKLTAIDIPAFLRVRRPASQSPPKKRSMSTRSPQ